MKLLKAYVRNRKVGDAIRALEAAGAPGITVSRVHGVGYGYDPFEFTLAPRELPRTPEVAKLEVVCRDADADRLLGCLVAGARAGSRGDGIVFITPVERAVRIRTAEEGDAVLGA